MSEDNNGAYVVGIPLDELPTEEPSSAEENKAAPPENTSDAPGEHSLLPDLFDPEELAAAGLTIERAETILDAEEDKDDATDVIEPAAEPENKPDSPALEGPAAYLLPDDEGPDADHTTQNPAIDNETTYPEATSHSADRDETVVQNDAGKALAVEDDTEIQTGENNPSAAMPLADGHPDQHLLADRLENLSLQFADLQREFEGKLKYDTHKDEIIDRLHAELQEYKQNILKKYVLSVVMDVVKVADDIRKWLVYFRSLEVSQRDPRKLFRYLEAIPSDLEDVFYWHGVKPFSNKDGPFDPKRQRAIKKVPTSDPALDKCVADSIRPGYEWETKVVRQEMVAVYVHQKVKASSHTEIIDE